MIFISLFARTNFRYIFVFQIILFKDLEQFPYICSNFSAQPSSPCNERVEPRIILDLGKNITFAHLTVKRGDSFIVVHVILISQ